jgi:3-phosphoshikimate 1-carboxyvinyltransferase
VELTVSKVRKISGTIKVPGDKSISHRALIIGALAKGRTYINGFHFCDDCVSTLNCLKRIGVEIEKKENGQIIVNGVGLHGFQEPSDVLNVGNSGTTIRLLPGLLAGQPFFSVLTGDASVRARPMRRIVEPLTKMGATIIGRSDDQNAPLAIKGGQLKGIVYKTPVASAQVKSAILLAGLLAEGETTVEERVVSRNHTELMLRYFGAELTVEGTSYTIKGGSELIGQKIQIPGDISSAAFFIVAALLLPDSSLTIQNVGLNPTRIGLIEVLKEMGARIYWESSREVNNEPVADVTVQSSDLRAIKVDQTSIPRFIDEIPILAVAATQAEGETIIKGAQELRVKETDRLAAITSELRKMGAKIEELGDGLIISGPTILQGARVTSKGDHRMAMALAIAGLIATGQTVIEEAGSISVSYPDFQQTLQKIVS